MEKKRCEIEPLSYLDVEIVLARLGISLYQVMKAKHAAESYSGKKVFRVVVPQPKLVMQGIEVVFGPVDKPTAELCE